jgi:hypothetical protein
LWSTVSNALGIGFQIHNGAKRNGKEKSTCMKEKRKTIANYNGKPVCVPWLRSIKRRKMEILQAILAGAFYPRIREVWMRPRSSAWFEMVETYFTDDQWYENFRVTKGTFAFILSKINLDISHKDTVMRNAVPAKRRLPCINFLASTAEYKTIANLFGFSAAFVCICVKEVCQAVRKRLPTVVSIPEGENLLQIIRRYEEKWGFPMRAGAVDGTHIPVLSPSQSHIDYVNRKGKHSIVMQAILLIVIIYSEI